MLAALISLMKKAASTSKTSVNLYQITDRNNPAGSHLQAEFSFTWVSSTSFEHYLYLL
jgi:hypothetical protein